VPIATGQRATGHRFQGIPYRSARVAVEVALTRRVGSVTTERPWGGVPRLGTP